MDTIPHLYRHTATSNVFPNNHPFFYTAYNSEKKGQPDTPSHYLNQEKKNLMEKNKGENKGRESTKRRNTSQLGASREMTNGGRAR